MFYDEDFFKIKHELKKISFIFYKFMEVGVPVFTNDIPTAAVYLDRRGKCLKFAFNEEFYKSLTLEEKVFVFCHEMLHIILNHGRRPAPSHKLDNIAKDIAIHEIMFTILGFNRDIISSPRFEGICERTLIEKQFNITLLPLESKEYYYNQLMNSDLTSFKPIDSHNGDFGMDDIDGLNVDESAQKEVERLDRKLSYSSDFKDKPELEKKENQKDDQKSNGQSAGEKTNSLVKYFKVVVKKSRRWDYIINNWIIRNAEMSREEQWAYKNPRLTTLKNAYLPYERVKPTNPKNKKSIFIFQDTSGSCESYAERFLKIARSIPEDRFEVNFYCFDTQVYKTNYKKGELAGFGGTEFSCIEAELQRLKNNGAKYPEVVFIITDGHGTEVSPEHPKTWHWILTESNSKQFIDQTSKVFELSNFE